MPSIQQILFAALSGLVLLSALGVVWVRHVVYGALFLGLCFASVGGLYALLGADFLFAAQILIYVGAIAVLFLFVVLLSGRRAEITAQPFSGTAYSALVAALLILALFVGTWIKVKPLLQFALLPAGPLATTGLIGEAILGQHAIGMEIMGFVLLVALVGASLLAPWQKVPRHPSEKEESKPEVVMGADSTDGALFLDNAHEGKSKPAAGSQGESADKDTMVAGR